MDDEKKKYPDIFPDGCPPEDSEPMELEVYRMIKGDIVTSDDFKSFIELGIDKEDPKNPFIQYGLSVNRSYEEMYYYWRGSPALKKKFKNIAKGKIYKESGVVKPTPSKKQSNHFTWWLYKGVNPVKDFEIVGGEVDDEKS